VGVNAPADAAFQEKTTMNDMLDAKEFQERLQNLDAMLREAEHFADPAARARLQQIVQAILELHGTGLERLLEHVADAGEVGRGIFDACARDDVVGGLLLLHGLHPLDLEERVRQALDSVRPYLRSHGGDVELLDVRDGVVRLRLQGSCHHCSSSSVTMQQTIEEAIYGKAPEVTAVEVDVATEELPAPDHDGFRVALPVL
jgi:Fe-S cluster biogenesis protein NfuA